MLHGGQLEQRVEHVSLPGDELQTQERQEPDGGSENEMQGSERERGVGGGWEVARSRVRSDDLLT